MALHFKDSRYNLLKLRPSQQSSWVGYSLAYYLLKDYVMALKVVSEYRKTMIKVSCRSGGWGRVGGVQRMKNVFGGAEMRFTRARLCVHLLLF